MENTFAKYQGISACWIEKCTFNVGIVAIALYGENGNDTLLGYDGYDKLYGGPGNDTLNGEGTFDDLYGGTGVDTLYGGAGADYFYFDKKDSGDINAGQADTIYDFKNEDQIWLKGSYAFAGATAIPADG